MRLSRKENRMSGYFVGLLFVLGIGVLIRFLGTMVFLWAIVPANTFAHVTTKSKKGVGMTGGGGAVTDIIHNIPGKRLMKKSSDPMDWYFEDGREARSLLFYILGVTWIGPFRTLRWNARRDIKHTEGDDKKQYHDEVRFIPFSGDHAVEVKEAETKSVFNVDFGFNMIYEVIFPLRYTVRVSNPNATLKKLIEGRVIRLTPTATPEEWMSGDEKLKESLVKETLKVKKKALEELGVRITTSTLASVTVSEKDKELFELPEKAQREQVARITAAETKKQEGIRENDVSADLFQRVTEPNLKLINEPKNRLADAIKDTKVGTLVIGGEAATLVGNK